MIRNAQLQNEQDNRHFGKAIIPILEPSDSQEAKEFTKIAFELSEAFDTPVILRITTRVAHSQSLVDLEPRQEIPLRKYEKNIQKYVMMPGFARPRHRVVENRLEKLKEYAETFPFNRMELRRPEIGIIASGVVYQYVREVLPDASTLKLALTYPLPRKLLEEFASKVEGFCY